MKVKYIQWQHSNRQCNGSLQLKRHVAFSVFILIKTSLASLNSIKFSYFFVVSHFADNFCILQLAS